MAPETRYARSGDLHIAYQVVGEGPIDLVYVPSWISQVEHYWEEPVVARLLRPARLVLATDHVRSPRLRAVGPGAAAPTLEEQMDDVVAVMDAAGSEQAAIFALLEGGAMAALFAATHPERTSALVLYEAMPRMSWAPDYDWAPGGRSERRSSGRRHELGRRVQLAGLSPASAENPRLRAVVRTARAAGGESRDGDQADDDERRGRRPGRASLDPDADAGAAPRRRTSSSTSATRAIWPSTSRGPATSSFPGRRRSCSGADAEALLDEIEEFLTGVRPSATRTGSWRR